MACRVPMRTFSETAVYYASKDGIKDGDGGKVLSYDNRDNRRKKYTCQSMSCCTGNQYGFFCLVHFLRNLLVKEVEKKAVLETRAKEEVICDALNVEIHAHTLKRLSVSTALTFYLLCAAGDYSR